MFLGMYIVYSTNNNFLEGVIMKYDELEKVEAENYPNDYLIKDISKKKRLRMKGLRKSFSAFDVAVAGAIFCASFALIMLLTSVISLAVGGILSETFTALFS